MKKVWLFLAFLGALGFVAACDDDPVTPTPDTDTTEVNDQDQINPEIDPEVDEGCQNNGDCAGDPAGEACNVATGECVECVLATDCEAGEVCTDNECVAEVTGCTEDGDCSGATPICNTATEECVECMLATDCADGESCDMTTYTCEAAGCESDADCSGATPVCNIDDAVCVECMVAGDCAADETCDMTTYTCEPVATGCTTDADCSGATPVCNTATDLCVECMLATDCAANETCTNNACAPVGNCDVNGFTSVYDAVEYNAQYDFMGYGAYSATEVPFDFLSLEFYGGVGNPPPTFAPGTFQLAANADEANYATCGTCLVARMNCSDTECEKTFFVTGGTLILSAIDTADGAAFTGTLNNVTMEEVTIDSQTFVSTPVVGGDTFCFTGFALSARVNAECETATDCPVEAPICSAAYTCVECETDTDCDAGETCNAEGACTVGGWTCQPSYYDADDGCDCECGAWDPDCDDTTQSIFGCADDEICEQPGVCAIANPCTTDADCTDPALPACDVAAGRCVECLANTDCTAPTGVCDTTAQLCVQCVVDGDCAAGESCVDNVCLGDIVCVTNGFDPLVAESTGYNSSGAFVYSGMTADADPMDFIYIGMDPAITVGAQDLSTTTSAQVFFAKTDAAGALTQAWIAEVGTLNITTIENQAVADPFVGSLVGVEAREVDTTNFAPLPGGEGWCLANQALNANLGGVDTCTSNADCAAPNGICGPAGFCVPVAGWTCFPEYLGDGYCDCTCGAWDAADCTADPTGYDCDPATPTCVNTAGGPVCQ